MGRASISVGSTASSQDGIDSFLTVIPSYPMNEQEREKALQLLERTRLTLRAAIKGVTSAEAAWKPGPDRWCILQYVEHLAISDAGLVALVKRIMAEPATPETVEQQKEREERIRSTPVPRGANRAPAALVPPGIYADLGEAMRAFEDARDRSIEFTRKVQGDLRSHFHNHGVLGPLDAYQWLLGNARHVETHSGHIRELRELWSATQENAPV